jgi:hypothetical protein
MKRVIAAVAVVVCCAGVMYAQDETKVEPPAVTVDPTQQTFNDVWMKWIEFNNWNKDAAYATLQNIEESIRADFPMDPAVTKQLQAISEEMYARLEAKAKEMGFTNFKDAFVSDDPRVQELKQIQGEYSTQQHNLTHEYYEEFNRRYQLACIDAISRLMENAQAIK